MPRGCIVNAWIERLIRPGARLVDRLRAACNVTAEGAAIQKKNIVVAGRRVRMDGNAERRRAQEDAPHASAGALANRLPSSSQLIRANVMARSGHAVTHKPHARHAFAFGVYATFIPCTRSLNFCSGPRR